VPWWESLSSKWSAESHNAVDLNNNNKYPMYSRDVLDSEQPHDDVSVVLDF
jgi:hypothetical protein